MSNVINFFGNRIILSAEIKHFPFRSNSLYFYQMKKECTIPIIWFFCTKNKMLLFNIQFLWLFCTGWPQLNPPYADLPIYRSTRCKSLKFCVHTIKDIGKQINKKIFQNTDRWHFTVENRRKDKNNNKNKSKHMGSKLFFRLNFYCPNAKK